MLGVIKNAKLFIFPSTVEATPIMLLEVASLGIRIICSDIPENVSVLEDNTSYFSSGDEKNLGEKIEFCLENYDEVIKNAERTRKWVLKKYNWKPIAKEYKNLYNFILYA